MHHSVPAPTLPPDPDDLYLPPPALRAGRMASVVWSCMKLVSTNTDFAWCTVCRKWYRYRADFNATYIKTLHKHCTSNHVVIDGKLRPVSSANTQPSASHTQSTPQPLPSQQPLTPNVPSSSSLQQQQQQLLHSEQEQQRRLQALHLQELQRQIDPRANPVNQNPISPSEMGQSPSRLQPRHPATAAPSTNPQIAPVQPTNNVPTAAPVPMQWAPAVTAQMPTQPNVTAAQPRDQQQQQQLSQLTQTYQRQLDPRRMFSDMSQGLSASQQQQQRSTATPVATATAQAVVPQQSRQQSAQPENQQVTQAPAANNSDVEMTPVENVVSTQPNGVATSNVASSARTQPTPVNTNSSATTPAAAPAAQVTNDRNISARNAMPPDANAASRGPNEAGQDAGTAPAPTNSARHAEHGQNGRVQQSSASQQTIQNRPFTRSKCELTEQVRRVAERSQRLMFNGINLFFHKAIFKVPSSEEEALQVMRQGTEDVDKDGSPDSDLYILCWSHTQFFSAQMAALGYRFVSSNLKRRAGQTTPPPVEQWLELHRYEPVELQPRGNVSQAQQNAPSQAQPSAVPPAQGQVHSSAPGGGKTAGLTKQIPTNALPNGSANPTEADARARDMQGGRPSTTARHATFAEGTSSMTNTRSSTAAPQTDPERRDLPTEAPSSNMTRKTVPNMAQPSPQALGSTTKVTKTNPPSTLGSANASHVSAHSGTGVVTNNPTPTNPQETTVKVEGTSVPPTPAVPTVSVSSPIRSTPSRPLITTASKTPVPATSTRPRMSSAPTTNAAVPMNGTATNQRGGAPSSSTTRKQSTSSQHGTNRKKKQIPIIDLT